MKCISWLALCFLTCCVPAYVPNARNTPMFRQAGELQAKVYYDPVISATGIGVQTAGSVTNHIGLMANYTTSNNFSEGEYYFRHHSYEGGIGYFNNYISRRSFYFDAFVGYGMGTSTLHNDFSAFQGNGELATFDYDRYFFQTSFGMRGKVASFCASLRLSDVIFNGYTESGFYHSLAYPPTIFIEPSFTGQFNFRKPSLSKLFMFGQVGFNIPPDGLYDRLNSSHYGYDFTFLNLLMGIGYRFNLKKEELDQPK